MYDILKTRNRFREFIVYKALKPNINGFPIRKSNTLKPANG